MLQSSAGLAVLVLLLQMPQASAALGSWAVQLYNQDPQTFVIGWRGILALHAFAIDTWFLAGFAVTHLPFAFRMHWATEPLWIFVSFSCISTGMTELLAAAECPPLVSRWFLAAAEPAERAGPATSGSKALVHAHDGASGSPRGATRPREPAAPPWSPCEPPPAPPVSRAGGGSDR